MKKVQKVRVHLYDVWQMQVELQPWHFWQVWCYHCLSFTTHKSLTILDCMPKGSHWANPLLLTQTNPTYKDYPPCPQCPPCVPQLWVGPLWSHKTRVSNFQHLRENYNSVNYQYGFCLLLPVTFLHIMPHFHSHLPYFSSLVCPVVPAPSLC